MKVYKTVCTSGQFGLDDMLEQLKQVQKLGPISGILKMIPGMAKCTKNQMMKIPIKN